MPTFVDAEAAVRDWINSLTATLVGAGRPLAQGAHLKRLRSAAGTCYALLSVVGGTTGLAPEAPHHRARISASIYGPTKEAAATAAVAYANTVAGLRGAPQPMGAASCLCAADVTGPLYVIDIDEPRYLVDADFYFRPV